MKWFESKKVNRITKRELYEALDLISNRGYNKNYKELELLMEDTGLFENQKFPYNRQSFKTARVFKGRAARMIVEALDLELKYDDY